MIGIEINLGNTRLDIAERDGIVLIDQVPYQESGPSISRTRIGSDKNVIVEYGDVAASQLLASQTRPAVESTRSALFSDDSIGPVFLMT